MSLLLRLKRVFSIDLRSLALFRVVLSLMILLDLFLRSFHLKDFYTDSGVLPRTGWLDVSGMPYWSLHAASGDTWYQVVLFAIAAMVALCLLVGYRSRLMTVISWVLLLSLMNRNPVVLQGGDILLVCMCFWAMFLPLGARWSFDAALQPELRDNPNLQRHKATEPQLYFSVATIAAILQVLYLYFFTALLKTGAPWRYPFEAAQFTMELQHFATPTGLWFAQFPSLLKAATVYVLSVEFLGPLLVLLPFAWPRFRIAGVVLLASLHASFMTLMHIGLFPLIDFMSLTLLLPSALWIFIAEKRRHPDREKMIIHYDEDCGFCLKMCLVLREMLLPASVRIVPAQSDPPIQAILERENSWVITDAHGKPHIHWQAMRFLFLQSRLARPIGWFMSLPPLMYLGNLLYSWIANNRATMSRATAVMLPFRAVRLKPRVIPQLLAAMFLFVITLFNISMLPGQNHLRPGWVDYLARVTRTDQKWSMFAPMPLKYSLFPQVEGTLRNGHQVNLYSLTSPEADWQAPGYMYPLYDGYRWRKYLDRLHSDGGDHAVRSAFGHYQCRNWNHPQRERDTQLGILTVHFVMLDSNTDGREKNRRRQMMWQHWCYPEFKPAEN